MRISKVSKTTSVVFLILGVLGTALLALNTQQSQAQRCDAYVSIDPPTKTVTAGGNFTVDVAIDGVTDMGGFEFELHYDPDVVHVEIIELGPFPGSSGRNWSPLGPDIDNGAGIASFGGFSFGNQPGDNGSGALAVVTLSPQVNCEANPEGDSTALDPQNVQVTDTAGNPINICVHDGEVTVECGCWVDLDHDGDVDVRDIMLIASHWGWREGDPCPPKP